MADDIIKSVQINSAGFGTISKLAMQDRRLHIAAKAIYAYFNSYAGGGDTCFPSRKKICFDLGISNDTLSKYLRQLTECGYIKVEQIKESGKFSHNIYTLCGTISPCPKISDTEIVGNGNLDTNINSNNINSISNNNKDKERAASRFTPPTVEQVKQYCTERHNNIDPESFVDFYESKGWLIGKNKMKDWKAAVRTWEKKEYRKPKNYKPIASKEAAGQAYLEANKDVDAQLAELFGGE